MNRLLWSGPKDAFYLELTVSGESASHGIRVCVLWNVQRRLNSLVTVLFPSSDLSSCRALTTSFCSSVLTRISSGWNELTSKKTRNLFPPSQTVNFSLSTVFPSSFPFSFLIHGAPESVGFELKKSLRIRSTSTFHSFLLFSMRVHISSHTARFRSSRPRSSVLDCSH